MSDHNCRCEENEQVHEMRLLRIEQTLDRLMDILVPNLIEAAKRSLGDARWSISKAAETFGDKKGNL